MYVPDDRTKPVIVPPHKCKGNKSNCKSFRKATLLYIVGKMYGRIVTHHVEKISEPLVVEGQSGFRKRRGCANQIFALTLAMKNLITCHKFVCFTVTVTTFLLWEKSIKPQRKW